LVGVDVRGLASTPEAALAGIREAAARGVADMKRNREEIPVPLVRSYSLWVPKNFT
jgi:predicted RNase H-like HicB family nuclease